jgi:hypothetical protein
MPTAEAQIETGRPSRYLVQLCQHAAAMGSAPHGHRAHHGDGPPTRVQAEWSGTLGVIRFDPWGQCTVEATATTLTLRIEAAGENELRQIRDLITSDLTRFGRRDQLSVTWQHGEAPGADPAV